MNPEWMLYIRAFFALLFVIGLIFLAAAIAKKIGLDQHYGAGKSAKRQLAVIETLYIDPRHRLVLVRSGQKEHLLLVGAAGDLLIESREGAGHEG